MSALTTPFLMPRVEEVVPDFAMLKDRLTGASVIEERYTATQVPSSGDSYTVGGNGTKLMIIRVANQNDYIDTSTMVLNFFLRGQVNGANGTTGLALDDHVFSTIDTINVKVGGQTVEVLNNVGHWLNALVQGSMPYNYYKQNGGFEGLYIYDKWNDGPGTNVDPKAAPDGSALLQARWAIGTAWFDRGRYYSVPLTMLGLCRLPTLFAARNFQDITIEILFRSQLAGCTWVQLASNTTTPAGNSAAISDVTLSYDCCRMSADYYALMDQELKMPNGSGVAYPIDTYQVQPATIPAGAAVGTGTGAPGALTRIVVAKGTRFLKGVYGVSKPSASESSFQWRNNSSNGNFAFSSYQVIINSKRYPQLQIQSSALAFQELQKAYNQLGSSSAGALISWFNYLGQPVARYLGTGYTRRQDDPVSGTKDGSLLGASAGDEAAFQVGVNLEQFLTNQPDAGGINTSTSGYQIAVELQQNGQVTTGTSTGAAGGGNLDMTMLAANLTHYVILHFTRVLTLKAGAVEILD
jgi:hypothetical protein